MELRTAFPSAVALGALLGVTIAGMNSPQAPPTAPSLQVAAAVHTLAETPIHWDLPFVWNASVERFVRLLGGEQSDRMALYLKRSGRYEGMIRGKLRERGMPQDLIYLSMIESGFNPTARSRASAVGLWQFMAPTARDYGLRVDSYVDERRDPEKSTDAALRYLQDLYDQFGSWNLAAAAYNTGAGRVSRVMREETGAVRGEDADFWRIRRRLPADTREYVPLIFAMAAIGKEPHKYGLGQVQRWLPQPTDTVRVPGRTELGAVARAAGVEEETLRRLNPQLVRGLTPPGDGYPVVLPDGQGPVVAARFPARAGAAEGAEPAPARVAARTYRVRKGDSVSSIARKHHVDTGALQRANGLGRRSILRPGQTLRIPG